LLATSAFPPSLQIFLIFAHILYIPKVLCFTAPATSQKTHKADTLAIYLTTNSYLCRFNEKPNPSPEHPWTERKFGYNVLLVRLWRILPGVKISFLI